MTTYRLKDVGYPGMKHIMSGATKVGSVTKKTDGYIATIGNVSEKHETENGAFELAVDMVGGQQVPKSAGTTHEFPERILRWLEANPTMKTTYMEQATLMDCNGHDYARIMGAACDLLDAAAAFEGIPALALVRVRTESGEINTKAWKPKRQADTSETHYRDVIIARGLAHNHTASDYAAIQNGLYAFRGMANRKAWEKVREKLGNIGKRAAGLD